MPATSALIVIVTIPEKIFPELPKGLLDNSHAVVVDTGNNARRALADAKRLPRG